MLELKAVCFDYEQNHMRFDLTIEEGMLAAIIGPSGAGKTTLLHLIAGFETPLRGHICLDGRDMTRLAPGERPVSMVFQENNLFAHLDIAANVGLGIAPDLRLDRQDRARVAGALERVGLGGFSRRLPGELSGGERQRAALARVLVRNKPLLLLDEPFAALGPAMRADMLRLVSDLHAEGGMSTLLVSHQPEDARLIASHTAFVQNGGVRLFGPTPAVFANTENEELKAYLGG